MGLIAHAQIKLPNPSLDGGNNPNNAPQYWSICEPTPDVLPVSNYFTQMPYHGTSYVGLGAITSLLIQPTHQVMESVGILSMCNLIQGQEHFFNLYLIQLRLAGITDGDSIQLKIWGGGLACDTAQLLWCSPVIKNTTWQRYRVNFIPNQNYQFLTFGSYEADAPPSDTISSLEAYLGIDSISDIILPHYKIVKATITQDTATHCFQLSSAAAYGGLNFQWSSIPSGFSSSAQNPGMVCPVVNTSYIVSFTTPCGSIVYDTVFADMHTGINDVKGKENKLVVYPNPANDKATIYVGVNKENIVLDIKDISGRVVESILINTTNKLLDINTTKYSNGVYLLQLRDDNGIVILTNKLVVTRLE
ncbi:MAG: hypothetical protein RJA07_1402 [Bacteroidota bacterium]